MRKLLIRLGILITMGTCLMLMGKTVTSIMFILGLVIVVVSSYGLGYFTLATKLQQLGEDDG